MMSCRALPPLIAGIERLQDISGGFGGFMVMVQDWAPREKVLHSYELLARYVMPHFQGTLAGLIASRDWASERRDTMQAGRLAGLKRATDTYYTSHR
jgi:limonene 1,2-monooxygenase